MRPSIASVVGQVTDTHWGQVLLTPHAYGVVEICSPDAIARTIGIHLLTKLTRIFVTPPVSLQALSDIADTVMSEDVLSLILLVPVGETLYLVSRGNGCVYLKRDAVVAKLLSGTGALSGDIRSGDTIIAATEACSEVLSEEELLGVFDHLTPSQVAEKLTMRIHEREKGVGGAALIFRIEEAMETEVRDGNFSSRVKALGRRMTTADMRSRVRRLFHRLRRDTILSPKRLITYTVIGLFVISVVLGIRRQYTERGQSNLTDITVQAKHAFDEGMALLELNPVKGRERLTVARDLLTPIVAKKKRGTDAKAISDLYEEVVMNLTRAMHVVEVTPELYFDMALLKKGAVADDVSLFEQTMGVLDRQGKTAFTLGILPKTGSVVAGGASLEGARHVAAYGDTLYVWTPSGIHKIRLSDQKTAPNVIAASKEWGTIADMAAFAGNLYLLDTQKGRIWKYVAAEQGFSTIFEYLNPDTLPDLSQSTTMAIDGSVWLGTKTGRILRFTSGKENSFMPQGTDTPLGNLLLVYTDVDTKMVYVLDRENNRVVVFDKDGLYMAQYVWGSEFAPTELIVSEKAGKLFLLRDGKIYTVDLK